MRIWGTFLCLAWGLLWASGITGANAQVLKHEALLTDSSAVGAAHRSRDAIAAAIEDIGRNSQGRLDARTMGVIRRAIAVSFKPEKILDSIDDALTVELTEAELSSLRTSYASQKYKRFSNAINAVTAEYKSNPGRLLAERPPQPSEHTALLQEIMTESDTFEDVISMMRITNVAIPAAIFSALNEPVDVTGMTDRFNRNQKQMQASYQQYLFMVYVRAGKNFSVGELEEFLEFKKTPLAKRYHSLIRKLFVEALMVQTDEFAKRLVQEMGAKPATTLR